MTVLSTDVLTIGSSTANSFTGGVASTVTTVAGPGTVYLAGASNYAGSWAINAGTLSLGSSTALGVGGVTFGSGSTGTLQLNGNNATLTSLTNNATLGTRSCKTAVRPRARTR